MNINNNYRSYTRTSNLYFQIRIGNGFIMLLALIYFFDKSGLIATIIPSVIVHELGHILVMKFFGASPTRLNATLSGFALDYSGILNEKQEMLTALAGPLLGLAFAFCCAKIGSFWNSEYFLMCAGISFILNMFNLLPAKPLDGGRILNFALISIFSIKTAHTTLKITGALTSFALIGYGLFCIAKGFGFSLFVAGIWLFILQQKKYCK